MTIGIFHRLHETEDLEIPESSAVQSELAGEQPTVADLVLPRSGYNFSDEFACLLSVRGGAKRE